MIRRELDHWTRGRLCVWEAQRESCAGIDQVRLTRFPIFGYFLDIFFVLVFLPWNENGSLDSASVG